MKPFTTTPGMTEEEFKQIASTHYPVGAHVKCVVDRHNHTIRSAQVRDNGGYVFNMNGPHLYNRTTGELAPVISYPPDYSIKPEQMIKGFVYVGICDRGYKWVFTFLAAMGNAISHGAAICCSTEMYYEHGIFGSGYIQTIRPGTESERAELYSRVEEQPEQTGNYTFTPAEPVKEEPSEEVEVVIFFRQGNVEIERSADRSISIRKCTYKGQDLPDLIACLKAAMRN